MPDLIKDSAAKEGEVLCSLVHSQITPADIELFTKDIESRNIQTLDVCFINDKVFESGSAIYRINGHWIFWHGHLNRPLSWDWKEDIDALINDDTDSHDLNENWECLEVIDEQTNTKTWEERKEVISNFLERQALSTN